MKSKKINKNLKEKINFIFLLGIFLILTASLVSSLSLTVPDKLEAYPGQKINTFISIQNVLEDASDVIMKGSFEKGSNIISFSDSDRIEVPAGKITDVPVRITIPSNAPVGTEYPVQVLFETVEGGAGTTSNTGAGFSINLRENFNVKVIAKPKTTEAEETGSPISIISIILSLVILIVIVVILWLVIKNKKQEPASSSTKSINPNRKK